MRLCEKSPNRIRSARVGAVDDGEGIIGTPESTCHRHERERFRYQSRPDRNGELRDWIVALAQRYRRDGASMIYLKLRQTGEIVNHKRVERLYRLEKLQVRRRRRKKIPVRDLLVRPGSANEVLSVDFDFDRIASGRTLKCLAIVDDATPESVAVMVEHCMGGNHLMHILDGICSQRGRPAVIRSDNGSEFTSIAFTDWCERRQIQLRYIEPGKPDQNVFVERFNGIYRRKFSMRTCSTPSRSFAISPNLGSRNATQNGPTTASAVCRC